MRALVLTLLLAGCGMSNAEQAELEDARTRVATLEEELAALQAQVAVIDGAVGGEDGSLTEQLSELRADVDALEAAVAAQDADQRAAVEDLDRRLSTAEEQVSSLSGSSGATAAALAELDSRLYDEEEGDVPRLDGVDEELRTDVDGLDGRLATTEAQVAGNTADIASNTATLAGHASDIGDNADAIADNAVDIGDNEAGIATNAGDIATNSSTITANTTSISANAGDIATNASDIATNASDISGNATDVSAVAARVKTIEDDYVPDLDDLFSYVSVDTADDEIDFGTADVTGVGGLTASGNLRGRKLVFRDCAGGTSGYNCTPMQCRNLCATNNEEMGNLMDALAYATSGRDDCTHRWWLDPNNLDGVNRAFPMYNNRTTGGCGRTGTGTRPRLEGGGVFSWTTTTRYACACVTTRG